MRIRNWSKFQHFKDRRPPWIKLYRDLLDDLDWHELSGDDAKVLTMLWLLAAENDGDLPSIKECSFRLRVKQSTLEATIERLSGWVETERYQVDIKMSQKNSVAEVSDHQEREVEREVETELLTPDGVSCPPKSADQSDASKWELPNCPHDQLVDLYHETLPALPRVEVLSDFRRGLLRQRWREVCTEQRYTREQGIEWFRDYFALAGKSEFLTGRTKPKPGSAPFLADFEWLIRPQNFVKVIEGKYARRVA